MKFLSTVIIYAVSIQLLSLVTNVPTVSANEESSSSSSSSADAAATCTNDDSTAADAAAAAAAVPPPRRRNEHLMPGPSIPGDIDYIRWKNGTILDDYAAQITLHPSFTKHMLKYCEEAGITDMYRRIFLEGSKNELPPSSDSSFVSTDGMNWYLQRPDAGWNSNMHWLSGNDEAAAEKYMDVLGEAGFDMVLDALGRFFNLDGIDCYSVGFIGVTTCRKSFLHTDFENVQGKAFNILIPLQLVEESDPEFVVETKDGVSIPIHYEYNTALVVGDETRHGTGIVDYINNNNSGDGSKFRMGISVYVADTNEENVHAVIKDYTDPFPPASAKYLLKRAGKHWKKDGSVRLAKSPAEKRMKADGTILDTTTEEFFSEEGEDYDYSNEDGDDDDDDDDDEEEEAVFDGTDEFDSRRYNRICRLGDTREACGPDENGRPVWMDYDRDQMYFYLGCDKLNVKDRNDIPKEETYLLMRQTYMDIVGEEKATIPPVSPSDSGMVIPFRAVHIEGRGRALVAAEFIPAGTLIWTTKQTGEFPDSDSYRKFIMALPVEMACQAFSWSYVRRPTYKMAIDFDEGVLTNNGEYWETDEERLSLEEQGVDVANVGCHEAARDLPTGCFDNYFATKDIEEGEELLVNYAQFAYNEAWPAFGLNCHYTRC